MKKVGIVTFNCAENYGAMLQELALQEFLTLNGYDGVVLNYNDKNIKKEYRLFSFSFNPLVFIKSFVKSLIFIIPNIKRKRKFKIFNKQFIKLSNQINSIKDLKLIEKNLDIVICGSDQIWNPIITRGVSDYYTLYCFSEKIKKISYAASVGSNDVFKEYYKSYSEKILGIDSISVREESTKTLFESRKFIKHVNVVLDPTLLLKKDNWLKYVNKKNDEKYILVYSVDYNKELFKIADYLSSTTGYKILHFENRNRFKESSCSKYISDPINFIDYIYNAEYVLTTSFHGTVFSIIFNKKYWTIPHKKTGIRVKNLLNELGLEETIINSLDDFKKKDINKSINYKSVEKRLDALRNKSKSWLLNSLKKDDKNEKRSRKEPT